MGKFKVNNILSDSIMILLRQQLKEYRCVDSYKETLTDFEIKTKEGIKYYCYFEKSKNERIYYLYNRNFIRRCKLGNKTIESKYFNGNIIPEIFENHILKFEIVYKAFKEGIKAFKERNINYDICLVLNNKIYLEYSKHNKLDDLIYYVWNKGYEFASKFPDPIIVYEQYQYLRNKALEKIDINIIKEFMLRNKDIHIYLDEKPILEKTKELENVKEIEYSYGHIVAKSKTYNLKMNILPLDEEILVFDREGLNEIAKCNVNYYPIEYNDKAIYEAFQSVKKFELENCIEKEKKEKEEDEPEE